MWMILIAALLLATAQQQTVFHPAQYQAEDVFPAQVEANRGHYQRVTGPAGWLLPYLWYDEVGKCWLIEEGSRTGWGWTPVHDGDVLSIDGKGMLRVNCAGRP